MEVKNCKGCGKLYNYIGGVPLCAGCIKLLDDKFSIVKEYIYDNPGVGIQIISEENEVSVAQIKKWVREERLSFSEDSPIGLECESCGSIVKTGKFCDKCKSTMVNSLENAYNKPKVETLKKDARESAKMRFFDR